MRVLADAGFENLGDARNRTAGEPGVVGTEYSYWSAAMFSDCPQPECDDFYAANVSGP